jgi:hypothetical protein
MSKKMIILEDAKLNIFIGSGSLVMSSYIRFKFDGDTILLESTNDGKNIGYISVNKKGEKKLLKWIKEGRVKINEHKKMAI